MTRPCHLVCNKLNDTPAAFLCVCLFVLQSAIMDYYLIVNISVNHLSWLGLDLINLTLLVFCVISSYSAFHKNSKNGRDFHSLCWLSWLAISSSVAVKTFISFSTFASHLVEEAPSFFGPNTLKTAIALGSCIFFLLLTTQHDSVVGSHRRRYINEMTGTVVFDILDTVDILQILFDAVKVDVFWNGLREIILVVFSMNFVIPAIPLWTLCKTRFGHHRPEPWVTNLHTFLLVLVGNLPILLVRLILWNVFSLAISPFTLKNCLLISMTAYDFYQHRKVDIADQQMKHHDIEHKSRQLPNVGQNVTSSSCQDVPHRDTCAHEKKVTDV